MNRLYGPAFVSLAALALTAGAAQAKPGHGDDVEIRNAVARVVVIVEDRTDVAVEIENGTADLPRPTVTRRDGRVVIDGGLRRRIGNCRSGEPTAQPGENASVEVRRVGRVELTAAPLIVIRTPRDVDVSGGGATFGSVGRGATSVDLGVGGCGGWTVANVDGPLSLSIGGSGDVRAGTSRSLEVSIGGSGDVSTGATGNTEISIAGSGDVNVARVDGRFETSIAGSGDVLVRSGHASSFEVSIAGGGDVDFRGVADSAEVSLMGGGDVRIDEVTGSVDRAIMGGGNLSIGRR